MAEDWKDVLGKLADSGSLPEGDAAVDGTVLENKGKKGETLRVLVDKKGRKGKTATIVEGFKCSDNEIEGITRQLKQKLGTGGSFRGGEILIQGDRHEEVARMLEEMGYKVK